ncbi:hypothetical protein [Amycolatopsis aidingensis]|uniref:hypothetical protein n=1 Tax=Amycolatopsis aidingensis TaxID=2842453 RepID=UPI001C0AB5EF|nr:hypothetical protein [Amycolatopsis aidingensis]
MNFEWSSSASTFGESGGNPALHKHRRELLEKLASNRTNPALAEMARGLLSGRTTPRQVIASGAYDELLAPHVRQFTSWYTSLSEDEKEAAAQRGQEHLDNLARRDAPRAQPARESPETRRPAARGDEEPSYDETDWTSE